MKIITKRNISIFLLVFSVFIIISGAATAYSASLNVAETSAALGISPRTDVPVVLRNVQLNMWGDSTEVIYLRLDLSEPNLKGVWIGIDTSGDTVIDEWFPCEINPIDHDDYHRYYCEVDNVLTAPYDDYILNQYGYQIIVNGNSSTDTRTPVP